MSKEHKEHIKVTYKGVEIMKGEYGLCVCRNCTKAERDKIDAMLEEQKSTAMKG